MHLKKYKLHFVGIGGVGMCGLAELLHNLGARVSGSDLGVNANVERLVSLGIRCEKGHEADFLEDDTDVLVYSSAVPVSNPEVMKAKSLGMPTIARAEILAEIMRLQRGIAVAGTHGKTTTTSMIGNMLIHAGKKPTIVVGGRLDLIKSTALLGEGEWMVAEADESDGSFLKLNPEVTVITNIDDDHMDYYKNKDNLDQAFLDFALKTPFYGLSVVHGDDKRLLAIMQEFPKKFVSYGFEAHNDYVLKGEAGSYQVFFHGKKVSDLHPALPGKHNAMNALAAFIVGKHLGLTDEEAAEGLRHFKGVGRRLEFKGSDHGLQRYDDYAHHPTELRATLQALREKYPDKKLLGVFQPHRYSRTRLCWDEFLECFGELDRLIITDIYAASEAPVPGVESAAMVEQMDHPEVKYLASNELGLNLQADDYQGFDVIITLGAGNVFSLKMND